MSAHEDGTALASASGSESGPGSGSESSGWPSALGDRLRKGFDATSEVADATADLATELSSFTTFQKRVDQLIVDLKGSEAGPGKVGKEQLSRHQFGGGDGHFVEAADLYGSYEKVITELEKLSKMLSDSIEGMGIAVLASHKGYARLDVDVRDRMAAIAEETERHYGGEYVPDTRQGHGRNDGDERKKSEQPSLGDNSEGGI
ncbi:hypothetical protein [Streptomyces sp. NPDC018031]|uniref:hypothetical protein n=1 Tax=Streptomyces sp. NPDC018031 TaxID=3365033 RepID=UPI00378844E5